jgi:hypothetical protein
MKQLIVSSPSDMYRYRIICGECGKTADTSDVTDILEDRPIDNENVAWILCPKCFKELEGTPVYKWQYGE